MRRDHINNAGSVVELPRGPRTPAPPQLPASVEHLIALVEVVGVSSLIAGEPVRFDAANGDLTV
jgi:hypothetical protein